MKLEIPGRRLNDLVGIEREDLIHESAVVFARSRTLIGDDGKPVAHFVFNEQPAAYAVAREVGELLRNTVWCSDIHKTPKGIMMVLYLQDQVPRFNEIVEDVLSAFDWGSHDPQEAKLAVFRAFAGRRGNLGIKKAGRKFQVHTTDDVVVGKPLTLNELERWIWLHAQQPTLELQP
jgi:hypothetical protein